MDERLRQSLLVEKYPYCDIFRGTREQLIAAGLVKDGQFPGDPDRGKTCCTYRNEQDLKLQVVRCSRSKFNVAVRLSPEVKELRKFEEDRRVALRNAKSYEAETIAALADSPDEYRSRMLGHWRAVVSCLFTVATEPCHGYYFSKRDIGRWQDVKEDIAGEIEEASINFSSDLRAAHIAQIKARTAQADSGYQATLAAIVAGAGSQTETRS